MSMILLELNEFAPLILVVTFLDVLTIFSSPVLSSRGPGVIPWECADTATDAGLS
jgi:hypothetical protein